jgi:hypothetical protein
VVSKMTTRSFSDFAGVVMEFSFRLRLDPMVLWALWGCWFAVP